MLGPVILSVKWYVVVGKIRAQITTITDREGKRTKYILYCIQNVIHIKCLVVVFEYKNLQNMCIHKIFSFSALFVNML